MRAALIPPKGYERTAAKSDYHLALAQIRDSNYRDFYANLDKDDHYVILDNGAAEGAPVEDKALLTVAAAIGAHEIVVPDSMYDMEATKYRVDEFIGLHEEQLTELKLMLVLQGQTPVDIFGLVDYWVEKYPDATLGVPRHFLDVLDNKWARFNILNYIEGTYGYRSVHLLGTSHLWTGEVHQLAREFPWVRGVDTSMPYNWTIARNALGDNIASEVKRPDGYFEKDWELNEELLNANIDTYLGWASGTEGAGS